MAQFRIGKIGAAQEGDFRLRENLERFRSRHGNRVPLVIQPSRTVCEGRAFDSKLTSGRNSGIHQGYVPGYWRGGRRRWNRIFARDAMSLSEARRLEAKLKRQKGGSGFFVLTGLQREGS